MLWRSRQTADFNLSPRATDLSELPREAWTDIVETADLLWQAWVQLFPNDPMWNPVGAGLTLTFLVTLIVWLIKVRPG